jgi:hypothetical protein
MNVVRFIGTDAVIRRPVCNLTAVCTKDGSGRGFSSDMEISDLAKFHQNSVTPQALRSYDGRSTLLCSFDTLYTI